MPDGRVLIGTGNVLTASPTWTRYDELTDCRCAGFTIDTGRQSEFDVTDTGNATVFFNDRAGTFNDDALIGRPIMLQVQDPITSTWQPQFRGVIDDTEHDVSGSAFVSNVQVRCKDIFDYLAQTRFLLGDHGDVVPAGAAGSIYYPDGPVATGTGDPGDGGRIEWILDDGGLDPTRYVVFSGNVDLIETFYDPDDPLLIGLRDACDAEFPGIANCYVDRHGRFVFHGRLGTVRPRRCRRRGSQLGFPALGRGNPRGRHRQQRACPGVPVEPAALEDRERRRVMAPRARDGTAVPRSVQRCPAVPGLWVDRHLRVQGDAPDG